MNIQNNFDLIATTFFGLENVLSQELKSLGAQNIKVLNRAVSFTGNKEMIYRSNLCLRTALKVLMPIAIFDAKGEKDLYNRIKRIDWTKFLAVNKTFAVDAVVNGPNFTHSHYVALKSKDAIADFFRDSKGIRPSVDTENPDVRINVHIYNTTCTVSIDTTGVPMSKRGYKSHQMAAPLNEVMAAALVLLSGWDKKTTFIDPMCGSGTIAIEAAMIANNVYPGKFRLFTFQKALDFDRDLYKKIKKELDAAVTSSPTKIYAFDRDVNALECAEKNAAFASLDEKIEFLKRDFFHSDEVYENAWLVFNPPYGERLEDKDRMDEFYKLIGDNLKQRFPNSYAWVFSGNLDSLKKIGLRMKKKIPLYNGAIECRLAGIELFRGSRE